jgi:polysaccharide export outer membrane protein
MILDGKSNSTKERRIVMIHARATVVVFSLLTLSLTGCFSSNPKDIAAFTMPHKVNVSSRNYILQPADEIEVHCTAMPEIDDQRQTIRPDGRIGFEGLGEIEVAGKTPAQVANILRAKALELYKLTGDNPVDVQVTAFLSKKYYVLGEVTSPGPQVYTGRDTLLNALAVAVPTVLAWEERIQVIRPSPSGDRRTRPKIFEVNFDRMAAHGDASKNVLLEEGDIVYVPPTVLAAAAMKIEEFIRPIARAFSGYYLVSPSAVPEGGAGAIAVGAAVR